MCKTLQKQPGMNGILLSFLLGAIGALAIFLPFLVVDKGFFIYCGDYNCQQIPFYLYVQQFIKNGGGTWSWATDLGSSIINSYSFYNIGSPFLWITMLFPSRWMPYLMVPLFMLKYGAIAASACLYLSRYARSRNMAVICSVAYAFCGFNIYNIFFNHMLDPVAIFPLLLWGMDAFIYDNKRGIFALFVGLALIDNYFFFLGNVVFVLLYFVVKVLMDEYQITLKKFGLLVFEAVLGVGIGMLLALPTYYNLIGNPRTNDFASGMGLIMYGNPQQYFAILSSLFLPPDPPYLPNLFPDAAIKWTSMSAFLPVLSIAGVAAYWKSRKRSSIKVLLLMSLIMALVPILNSSFYAFNASYYARWYYMPVLIACFATMRSLEDDDIDLAFGAKAAVIATGVFVIFGLLPGEVEGEWKWGVAQEPAKFWLTFITAMLGVLLFYFIVRYYRHKVRFGPLLLSAVMGFSVFYAVVHISLGKFPQWENDANYKLEMYDGGAQISLPEDHFYRIDAYNCYDNLGLWIDKSCLQCFNSVVTPSIMEFYPLVGVKRDVSSKPETKYYALRGLLNVQYTIMPTDEVMNFENDTAGSRGWDFHSTQGPYTIYENQNFLPLGFTYDNFIDMAVLESIFEDDRSLMLVRAIGLDDDQIQQYGSLFEEEIGEMYSPLNYETYVEDCIDRKVTASYDTQADSSGFTTRILMEEDDLVFYSVPYDPGFSATVNGEPAEVLKVSGGMMAVFAPAGDNEIVFTYETPGFKTGLFITMGSLAVLIAYMIFIFWRRKNRPGPVAIETISTSEENTNGFCEGTGEGTELERDACERGDRTD